MWALYKLVIWVSADDAGSMPCSWRSKNINTSNWPRSTKHLPILHYPKREYPELSTRSIVTLRNVNENMVLLSTLTWFSFGLLRYIPLEPDILSSSGTQLNNLLRHSNLVLGAPGGDHHITSIPKTCTANYITTIAIKTVPVTVTTYSLQTITTVATVPHSCFTYLEATPQSDNCKCSSSPFFPLSPCPFLPHLHHPAPREPLLSC
jgi:hypothetical protein